MGGLKGPSHMNSSKSLHVHVGAGVPVSARFLRSTNDQQGVQRNHKVIVGNMVHDLQRLDFCGSSKRKHGARAHHLAAVRGSGAKKRKITYKK